MTEARDDLLFEIGSEELPPMALSRLARALADSVGAGLQAAKLPFDAIQWYATPRRLAVMVSRLAPEQPDIDSERRGPALAAAFDAAGAPTQALRGFAKSCGVAVEALQRIETDKGVWMVHRSLVKGQPLAEVVPDILSKALAQLPIPKRMRWGSLDDSFVRPVHWLVLLYGNVVLPYQQFGISAGRNSYGHRFHHPQAIEISHPRDYPAALQAGHVMVDFEQRKQRISTMLEQAAQAFAGHVVMDDDLLELVTAIVEWPVPIVGRFEQRFLDLPRSVISAALKGHQKCFPLSRDGALLPNFITISNVASSEPQLIAAGNERVVRARLDDAAFFFRKDLELPLVTLTDRLKGVVFQNQLGSIYDKVQRIRSIAQRIAAVLNLPKAQCDELGQAAQLCKTDLQTHMVFEFPELQGEMGYQYARRSPNHLSEAVAKALNDYYLPRFAGDSLPADPVSWSLALADRIDSIAALFAVGQAPSGERDPFALRRAALGVIRILIERSLDLNLAELFTVALQQLPTAVDGDARLKEIEHFVRGRLRGYYLEQGVDHDTYDAVDAVGDLNLHDFDRRIRAIAIFRRLPEAAALAAANKRIANILEKSVANAGVVSGVDKELLTEPAEQLLYDSLKNVSNDLVPLMQGGDYEAALVSLAGLREPVDRFFDEVMVMCDDASLRSNRIALLNSLRYQFLQVADVSRLQAG